MSHADNIEAAVRDHAERIMRAAGSSLGNYTLNGSRERILAAVIDCYEEAYRAGWDAAIATMFERLRTPLTDALKFAYCQGARDVSYELTGDTETTEDDFGEAGDDYAAIAASELLTAFQQENSDA